MKNFDFYKLGIILLIVAIFATIGIFVLNLKMGKVGRGALKIDVVYGKASVLIDGEPQGETQVYKEKIIAKDTKIDINGNRASYSTTIKPAAGTLAVVNRDLGVDDSFKSGQNIWFTKVGGNEAFISVISPDTSEVSVVVDGVEMGKAPIKFSTKDLLTQSEDGSYTLSFSKEGYEDQEADVKVKPGYELTIRVDMFLKPLPTDVSMIPVLPDGVSFINLSNVSNPAFADKQSWASAINYWLETRGAATLGDKRVEKFNYFVADDGKVYNEEGNEISPSDVSLESGMFVAYLGTQQNNELTDEAKGSISQIINEDVVMPGQGQVTIKIKPTGIGFLRVRSGPGTGNAQVGKVDVGEEFVVLGEDKGWYKIEYDKDKEGWISGAYVTKQEVSKED